MTYTQRTHGYSAVTVVKMIRLLLRDGDGSEIGHHVRLAAAWVDLRRVTSVIARLAPTLMRLSLWFVESSLCRTSNSSGLRIDSALFLSACCSFRNAYTHHGLQADTSIAGSARPADSRDEGSCSAARSAMHSSYPDRCEGRR